MTVEDRQILLGLLKRHGVKIVLNEIGSLTRLAVEKKIDHATSGFADVLGDQVREMVKRSLKRG